MAYQEPPELITFDEQVVECEIEIDTFDEEEEIVGYEDIQTTSHLESINYADDDVPGPSGYHNPHDHHNHHHHHHYQYEEEEGGEVVVDDMDPNNVYLYDEDTSQLHQIDDSAPFLDDSEDVVNYTTGPSTSSESVLTSSDIPSTSSGPPGPSTPFQAHQRGEFRSRRIQNPQNTYYIRKTHGIGQHHQQPVYSPVTFQTQYTCEPLPGSAGKRVLKRTHIPLSTEEMETIMEDTQVMKRIQSEITHLKKTNGDLKKDYEKAHREFEAMNMEWVEAKTKQKQANEEKRELAKELAQARVTHTQLLKQVALANQPEYQFH